ncbi:MAG: ABC transporter permease, partial [Muribaculaceae bacterium]|nr:ABC transporter permease [Muribaculaceae bacterium]
MKFRILIALLKKEVTLMRRNPIIPKIIFVMPLMVMLVIPLVANLDVKNVIVTVVDNDHSQLSRRIVADIDASEFLTLSAVCETHTEAMKTIENGDADVLLTIPADFSKKIIFGGCQVDVEANGVNATKGMLGGRYVTQSVISTLAQFRAESVNLQ